MYINFNLKRCDKFVFLCSFKVIRGYNFDVFVKKIDLYNLQKFVVCEIYNVIVMKLWDFLVNYIFICIDLDVLFFCCVFLIKFYLIFIKMLIFEIFLKRWVW